MSTISLNAPCCTPSCIADNFALRPPDSHPLIFLTWQSDESLTLHPPSQHPVKHRGPVRPLKSGEQRHQLGHWRLWAQVLHTQDLHKERESTVKLVMFCSAHLLTVALCRVESISDDTRMWPSVSSCSLDVLAGNYNYSIQQLSSSSIYKWVPLNLHILKVVNCCEMICSILMCHFSSATVQPTYSFTVPLMLSLWGTGNKYTTRRGGCAHFQMM